MERKKKNRSLELGKDLLIAVLALGAVYLTLRTLLPTQFSGGAESGWLGGVLSFFDRGVGNVDPAGPTQRQSAELRPLRMAVNIAGQGRYGVQYDSAATVKLFDEVFSTLLSEALGSARAPRSATEQEWRKALSEQTSVYFDFHGQVPLGVLYGWLEAGPGETLMGERVRRLLLAEEEGGALLLYYCNEDTGMYYACQTADTLAGHLQSVAAACISNINDTSFVYEKKEDAYKSLSPYVMLPSTPVLQRAAYQAVNPIAGKQDGKAREELIEALGFHPQANTSYMADGRLVVKEGADTLVVYDSGAVDYHSASAQEPRYGVGEEGKALTERQLVEATQPIAQRTVGAWCAEAKLYLMGITDLGEGRTQVDYGYHLNGVTVRLGAEGYAARFIVSGGQVSDFYLVLRAYTATSAQTAVLPERQAAAAVSAMGEARRELALVYEDGGSGETVQAGWIAEEG